ncbi:hypothetical protein A3D78_04295 [Candidatus Gottesmanbacteria bacterium RIFCSPHIGHO2_02_FULL_39_14]|uniref:Uncharacterized protein n=2 Tax=Candidatus Gottesmaniibacteriota TaxID=1752720 RepID=A0A1F5ZU05_9BACT|nr:MAG: hypothetical protein A2153_00395 [Candidatus Gottesmanbacteria bacterium RBG_16_38_7b]OGG15815.1 MAG: hypothetical protein A3D78_04295 [Candidatus Gottesmanbacteria bacterium RIFCSPHIGHO2_02_FULL_39_14]
MNPITRLEEDIKNLKIQGATNIAFAVLDGLTLSENTLKHQINLDPHIYLLEQSIRLAFVRPTEPLAQNAVRFIFQKKQTSAQDYLKLGSQYKKMISEAKNKMGKFGADLITDGGVYLTHCHSTTVTNMFITAAKQGKKFQILVTETRPLYQGRITAQELLEAGIDHVTMIIDDVATSLLLKNIMNIKAVFIGADLLSQEGFVNKVGSLGIAFAARENQIPVYSMSILLKYDPRPYTDDLLERRESMEIWPDAPKDLKFHSPAFDYIPYDNNISIISETGLLKGAQIKNKALELYPFLASKITI